MPGLEDPRQPRRPTAEGGQAPDTPTEHPVARAHLRTDDRPSPPVHRYEPAPDLRDRVRHVWLPVWDIPPGQVWEQHVLAYPCCQFVVGNEYARFYGVVRGLSRVSLEGRGWVVGTMLAPGAGWLVTRTPVSRLTDTWVDLAELEPPWAALVDLVRSAMATDPSDPAAHRRAADHVQAAIREHLTLDPEGALVTALVDAVEGDPDLHRVDELALRFALSERSLQRIVSRRLGLTPRWLIQRRRLHEAAQRLRWGQSDLAELAAELGYADHAHFAREFRAVTGQAPSQFRARATQQDPAHPGGPDPSR